MPRRRTFHILFLIDELKTRGGTERHLLDLVQALSGRGITVTVMALSEGEFSEAFKALPSITYACLNVKRIYDLSGIRGMLALRRYLAGNEVRLIQTLHTASDLIGPLVARSTGSGIAVVSSRRDMGYTKLPRHLAAQRLVNRFVDALLANSRAVEGAVRGDEGVSSGKTRVIYNGIDAGRFGRAHPETLRRLSEGHGIGRGGFHVGSVGNLRPVKGYRGMVELAARLCPLHPDLRFLLAGEGEERGELESLCRAHGVSDRFLFFGKVEAIPEFLSLLDVYLQPSLSEGFSNAILEAMAAGLPIVATDVGGNPEMVRDGVNGFLVPPGDVGEMEERIELLMADAALRARLGDCSRARVLDDFRFETMVERYLDFYEGLCQGAAS